MLRLINQLLEFRKMQNNKTGAFLLEETDVISFPFYENIFLSFRRRGGTEEYELPFLAFGAIL